MFCGEAVGLSVFIVLAVLPKGGGVTFYFFFIAFTIFPIYIEWMPAVAVL